MCSLVSQYLLFPCFPPSVMQVLGRRAAMRESKQASTPTCSNSRVYLPLVVSWTHLDLLSASSCCDELSDSRWSSSHPDPPRSYCNTARNGEKKQKQAQLSVNQFAEGVGQRNRGTTQNGGLTDKQSLKPAGPGLETKDEATKERERAERRD